jgi:hypothetical protein
MHVSSAEVMSIPKSQKAIQTRRSAPSNAALSRAMGEDKARPGMEGMKSRSESPCAKDYTIVGFGRNVNGARGQMPN